MIPVREFTFPFFGSWAVVPAGCEEVLPDEPPEEPPPVLPLLYVITVTVQDAV